MDLGAVMRHTIEEAAPRSRSIFGSARSMSADQMAEFIKQYPVALVSTVDSRGAPHVSGKAAVLLDGKIYFGTREEAAMGRNLRRNPNVAVAFAEPPWKRHVFIYGTVRFLEVGSQEERLVQDSHRSIHGYESSGLAEVSPQKILTWKGSE